MAGKLRGLSDVEPDVHDRLLGLQRLEHTLDLAGSGEFSRPPTLRHVFSAAIDDQYRLKRLRLRRLVPSVDSLHGDNGIREHVEEVLESTVISRLSSSPDHRSPPIACAG